MSEDDDEGEKERNFLEELKDDDEFIQFDGGK
jgi:hypothetical protein